MSSSALQCSRTSSPDSPSNGTAGGNYSVRPPGPTSPHWSPSSPPSSAKGAGFLRILRTLRLLRTYQLLDRLRSDSGFFRRNEEVILAAANLSVFVFVMTGLVYATQHRTNPAIANYVDALYFTVTSLTTTGYGDVTLPGTSGRLLSVVVMICGVTLFLRLAQVLFRPNKVRHPCPACALQRHEPDAVHCKACGTVLSIPDEGEY